MGRKTVHVYVCQRIHAGIYLLQQRIFGFCLEDAWRGLALKGNYKDDSYDRFIRCKDELFGRDVGISLEDLDRNTFVSKLKVKVFFQLNRIYVKCEVRTRG